VRCDVVSVGTELLLGQIVDTNSSWLGEQLSLAGIDSHLQVKVGDNRARIVRALRRALEDADAVIMCGGLGPTHDDITRESIAEVMGEPLELRDDIAQRIESMFTARGRRMPANNLRQAEVPRGAQPIDQRRGTAPGLICPIGDKVVYAVPGVPYEMTEMFEREILPDLLRRAGSAATIRSRVMRTWGESESGLNERLHDVIERLEHEGNPTLAFLASGWEGIKVRLTAKSATTDGASALLDRWEREVRDQVGDIVFGTDAETMESVVLDALRSRGLTLGIAESVTGGLVAGRLTNVPGASAVLRGCVVAYASDVKFDLLGVDRGPVVNEQAARQMASGARRVLGADVGLALTGVAGPDSQDGVDPGTLCVGIAMPDGTETSSTVRLPGTRDVMRQLSVISALDALRRRIEAGT
jgi:nicotinamide-nucleotide amidase